MLKRFSFVDPTFYDEYAFQKTNTLLRPNPFIEVLVVGNKSDQPNLEKISVDGQDNNEELENNRDFSEFEVDGVIAIRVSEKKTKLLIKQTDYDWHHSSWVLMSECSPAVQAKTNIVQMKVFYEAYEIDIREFPEKNVIGAKQYGEINCSAV